MRGWWHREMLTRSCRDNFHLPFLRRFGSPGSTATDFKQILRLEDATVEIRSGPNVIRVQTLATTRGKPALIGRKDTKTGFLHRSGSLGMEVGAVAEFVQSSIEQSLAAVTLTHVSKSADRECGVRYRHLHAERGRRLVDGVAQRRSNVCGAHPDGIGTALLCARPAGGGGRRYSRPAQNHPGYGDMDDRGGISGCRVDAGRAHVAAAPPDSDVRVVVRRCLRIPHMARATARTGGKGGPARGVCTQRHRV